MADAQVVQITIPADLSYLSILSACLQDFLSKIEGISDSQQTIYNIQLCAQEVCTNIVLHAYKDMAKGQIHCVIRFEAQTKRLSLLFHDTGRTFDLLTILTPNLDQGQVGGYGLFIVKQLMDEMTYRVSDTGNEWILIKRLS